MLLFDSVPTCVVTPSNSYHAPSRSRAIFKEVRTEQSNINHVAISCKCPSSISTSSMTSRGHVPCCPQTAGKKEIVSRARAVSDLFGWLPKSH